MNDRRSELTPEERARLTVFMSRARSGLRRASVRGVLLALGGGLLRRSARGTLRRQRRRLPRLRHLIIGLAIVLLSITTCSAGVDLASLTEDYGPAVPANRDAARRFVERVAAAVRDVPASGRLRLEITDVEATSALSLGLMMPELMQAMETMTAEEVQRFDDLAALREHLRARAATRRDSATVLQRIGDMLDPRIRSGDVQVRFTAGGEIVMAGYIQAWRWQQPALVVFAPRARSGELELDFRRGRLGRLPAPERAFDRLAGLAASLILQGREYAEITELTVEEGRLTFVGLLKHRP